MALNSPSKTFDLVTGLVPVEPYFKGANRVVDEQKCNDCHDALATTFHSANRGPAAGDGVVVCKHCHYPAEDGSHMEMQSRSIESYAHAIHSFQAFDTDEVDFTNPVEAKKYRLHIEHVFPNFTIKNCEGCHEEDTFNVPDQRESMPGWISPSYQWNVDRNIGTVPSYVTGPASRACGACHRAHEINEDSAGGLASFNQHTKAGGYLVEYTDDNLLYGVINKMMDWFE